MKRKNVIWLYVVLGLLMSILLGFVTSNIIMKNEKVIDDNEDDFEPYGNFYDQNGYVVASNIEANVDYPKAYVKFYDESGYLINSYTQEKIEERVIETDIYKKSEEMTAEDSYGNFYDENGLLINQSEDINKEISKFADHEDNVFVFHYSTFSEQIIIGQDKKFHKPKSIIIEPDVKFESMTISLINSKGKTVGEIKLGNFVEALNIELDNYIEDDIYSIKFINENKDKSIKLVGGVVIYN